MFRKDSKAMRLYVADVHSCSPQWVQPQPESYLESIYIYSYVFGTGEGRPFARSQDPVLIVREMYLLSLNLEPFQPLHLRHLWEIDPCCKAFECEGNWNLCFLVDKEG